MKKAQVRRLVLARLKARVAALDCNADAPALAEVSNRYPEFVNDTRGVAKSGLEVSLNRRKQDLLGALDEFEKGGAGVPGGGDFGAWLKDRLEKYEAWLSRLQAACAVGARGAGVFGLPNLSTPVVG